jgi:hypothetical protein
MTVNASSNIVPCRNFTARTIVRLKKFQTNNYFVTFYEHEAMYEIARIDTKKPAHGGLSCTRCSLFNSTVSACDDEEHGGQECHQDNNANGQKRHIRRQGLSDASRPRSFFVWEHMVSQLPFGQARVKRAPMPLLLCCFAAGCCKAE